MNLSSQFLDLIKITYVIGCVSFDTSLFTLISVRQFEGRSNNMRSIEKKIERLRTVRRIRGEQFIKDVLARPELVNHDVLTIHLAGVEK